MLSYSEDLLLVQEDHEARFYREYSQAAEEYDREFHEKYDEDSNTSLIFASTMTRGFDEHWLTI